MAEKASKSLEIVRSSCSSCKKYAPTGNWVLGHYYCSSHRDCTGKRGWLPDSCDACIEFKEGFDSLTGGEQHSAIAQLKVLLRKTSRTRCKYGPWTYLPVLKSRFPTYFGENGLTSSPTAASPRQGELDEHQTQRTSPSALQVGAQAASQHQPFDPTHQVSDPPASSNNSRTLDSVRVTINPPATTDSTMRPGSPLASSSRTFDIGQTLGPAANAEHMPTPTGHGLGAHQNQSSDHRPMTYENNNFLSQLSQVLSTTFRDSMGALSSKLDIIYNSQARSNSRLEKFLTSKRSRSRSYSRGRSSSSDIPRSRSSSGNSHSRSRSPTPNRIPPRLTTPAETYFIEDGKIWLWITKDTEFTGSKVKTAEGWTPYISHSRKNAYRTTTKQNEPESPFMGTHQALDTLVSFLSTHRDAGDKVGPSNRSFRGQLDDSSYLGHALRIILKNSPKAIDAIYRGDTKEYAAAFPSSAFDPVSVINYTTGWHFTKENDFSKFASSDFVDLNEASRKLEIRGTIWVPKQYLTEEKSTRIRLVEYISNLGMLDGIINKVEANSPLQEALKANARHSLSFLKDYTDVWYKAKYLVRRIALQYSTQPIATKLLCSNMWEASLFASDAITEFISNDVRQEGSMRRLDIEEEIYATYKSKPELADPKRHADDGKSKSSKRRNSSSHRPRRRSPRYIPENRRNYSDQRSLERYNQTSRPNRGGFKRQRVSFQDQRNFQDQRKSAKTSNVPRTSGSSRGRGPYKNPRRQ